MTYHDAMLTNTPVTLQDARKALKVGCPDVLEELTFELRAKMYKAGMVKPSIVTGYAKDGWAHVCARHAGRIAVQRQEVKRARRINGRYVKRLRRMSAGMGLAGIA